MARKPSQAKAAGDKAQAEAVAAGSPADDAAALGTVVEGAVEEAAGNDPAAETATIEDAAQSDVSGSSASSSAPIPPAPGDDPASVFDRRIERLTNLVADAKFESGTAFGDLRDCMLEQVKHAPKLWSAMLADERQTMTRHIESVARRILSRVVQVVAEEDSHSIQATILAAFNVKGESVEIKAKVDQIDGESLLDIYRLAGHRVVIISADDKRFASARKAVDIPADQLGLAFADDGPARAAAQPSTPPAAPEGDTDLADGADQTHRVADEDQDGTIYLCPDEEKWTNDTAQAGAWTVSKAEALADKLEARVEPVEGPGEPEEPEERDDRFDDLTDDDQRTHGDDSAIND